MYKEELARIQMVVPEKYKNNIVMVHVDTSGGSKIWEITVAGTEEKIDRVFYWDGISDKYFLVKEFISYVEQI